ncbi:type I restriction-modification system DNA methylase subunit [Anoxybacillus tepidamans]|uniref:site-specific DNA-methyltransferase (adenine-specific) n=1 Tax=Anoxybacteroides tepidamans TaxID=265948 RepID=A0A7W8MVF9_9BACL|nr:type I restriction-modification system subunit M N-terminal domain-containing protein [Anoxybacillus tepidamans]MBB5324868.1 type I restriction-modification system DNA methylase subunit [Anoxybacillus tepidamans]
MDSIQFQDKVSFIWANADLLRGDYKQSEYGKVILPLTVIRRIDAVLEPTKEAVLSQLEELKAMGMTIEDGDFLLQQAAEQPFYNTSNFTLKKLLENFIRSKTPQALKSFLATKNSNEQLFKRLFTDKDFQETVLHAFLNEVYEAARSIEIEE